MSPDKVDAEVKAFKQHQGVMLCTNQFAQSFALDTANTAYVIGWSWSPDENIQAEGRLIRLDSPDKERVLIRYLIARDTVEDRVRDVVNGKYMSTQQIFALTAEEMRKYNTTLDERN